MESREGEPDLSSMSQSELEELQRKNCVFCHIASGKVPAKKVYEDEQCIAVLDINPANPGHVLLMPKEHYTIMFQVPDETIGYIFVIAKALSEAGLKAFQTKGTTILAANGVTAGQRAPHFMLHIIPRMSGDSIGIYIPSRALPEKEAGQIATALAAALRGNLQPAIAATAAAKSDDNAQNKEAKEAQKGQSRIVKAEVARETGKGRAADKAKHNPGRLDSQSGPSGKTKKTDLDAITDFLATSRSRKGGST